MSRSRHVTSDSLDLLLDTICNTFGSLLFLSLLIVLMVQHRSREVAPTPPSSQAEMQLAQLQNAIQQLQIRQANLQRVLQQSRQFARPEKVTVELHQWRQWQRRVKQLEENNADQVQRLASLQQAMNRLARQMEQEQQQLQQQRETVARLRRQVQQQIARQTREIRLPRLRTTFKDQVVLFLQEQKLFVCHRVEGEGFRRRLVLSDECEVVSLLGQRIVMPNKDKGLPISSASPDRVAIRRRLRPFRTDSEYLHVFVWPDSFAQWRPLHEVIETLGFDYTVVPMEQDEVVGIGASGPTMVQ